MNLAIPIYYRVFLFRIDLGFLLTTMYHRVAGHPLAQSEIATHMFLQEATIDRDYTPGKVRAK